MPFLVYDALTYHYAKDITENEQCFYEVLMGQKSRKPYFDIDIEHSDVTQDIADGWIEKLIENICELVGSDFTPVIIMTSHRPDKLSYHLSAILNTTRCQTTLCARSRMR